MSLDSFIARQPILDRRLRVAGYELLHRSGWDNEFRHSDPDRATLELLNCSMLVNRLSDLTDGRLGFVNVTRNLLVQDFIRMLPVGRTVIEVLETVEPDDEVVRAVRALKREGHLVALDDYVGDPKYDELVALADYVKVDFADTEKDWQREVVARRRRAGLVFLAEKIETREQFVLARESGYRLFQGYFFCRPELSSRRDLPRCKINYVHFLREMARPGLDIDRIEELVKQEISLSAKLLRYMNSVHFGVKAPITSIRQALVHLGERPLKRWGTLIALTGLGEDKPLEIVRVCLVRARFCEALAEELSLDEAALDLFLTGLFSAIDALVDRPLDEALADLGVKPEIERAIRGDDEGDLGRAFSLVRACERGDIALYEVVARHFGIAERRVAEIYFDAIVWADRIFKPDGLAERVA